MFVRAIGDHAYIANQWDLSAFDGKDDSWFNTGYVVFDDVAWDTFKWSAKSFCGGQQDFSVTDKYRKKRRIKGALPCFVLLNPDADDYQDYIDFANKPWGRENITVVRLVEPMYGQRGNWLANV